MFPPRGRLVGIQADGMPIIVISSFSKTLLFSVNAFGISIKTILS